ncbi:MAG: amino acid ABC transporter periplasmic protein [Comamonadaceae bacterium]|nr:MAG: amino acid ABC transporter periplasmic protein [Comamonadaceae bacterium]
MKLLRVLIVMSCLALGLEEANAVQSEVDLKELLSKVTVVTCIEPPYQMQEEGRPLTGVSVELVQMMLKEADVDLKIEVYPWARAYGMAQRQENVLLFSILRNPPREKLFKWVDALHPFHVNLYRMKNRPDIVVNTLEDAKKYRIGVLRDDSRNIFLRSQGFGGKLDEVALDSQNIKKLFLGRIDLLPSDPIVLSYWFKVINADPASLEKYSMEKVEGIYHVTGADGENYVAMSPQTDDRVVEHFRRALDRVKTGPQYQQLLDKYMK